MSTKKESSFNSFKRIVTTREKSGLHIYDVTFGKPELNSTSMKH